MTTQIEIRGKWKVPNSTEWIIGTLKFDPDDEMRLEVFGTFNKHIFDRSLTKIIIGDTTSGEITLVENHYVNYRTQNDILTSIYQPTFIIEGKHFESEENISFRKVIFRAFNLFEWIDTNGLKTNLNQYGKKFSIEYEQPTEIKFILNDNCTGFFSFDSPINFTDTDNKIEIKEHCYVTLNYCNKNPYKDILRDIHFFIGFITLCTHGQSYPIRITFQDEDYLENIEGSYHLKFIYCHYLSTTYSKKHRSRRKHEHLVPFKEISESLPIFLKNWYEKYKEIEPVLNLMLYSFRDKNKFNSEKFMDVVRSLETFHRRLHKNHKIPKSEYLKKVNHILNNVDLNDKEKLWLKERLDYGNEPTLNERVRELFDIYTNSYLQVEISDIASFCRSVVQSRNYYTHYDISLEKKALRGEGLFLMYKKLLALLMSCVLETIGIDKKIFEKNLKNILE
jgi:hypothetical protein